MDNNRTDWGDNYVRQSRKISGGGFSSLLSRNKSPRSGKNNNKFTGSVTRGGGGGSAQAIKGLSGLHKTLVDRPINLRKGVNISKVPGVNTRRNQSVTRGGGHTRRAVVQAKPSAVKVRPES